MRRIENDRERMSLDVLLGNRRGIDPDSKCVDLLRLWILPLSDNIVCCLPHAFLFKPSLPRIPPTIPTSILPFSLSCYLQHCCDNAFPVLFEPLHAIWPMCSLDALDGAKNDDAQHDDETDSKGDGK